MRRAGRELLSLALMDARNHTLHLLSLYEEALGSPDLAVPRTDDAGVVPPVWLAGHIGWFAEWWIGRNTQRAFGADCPVRPTRLAAIDPNADEWWNRAILAGGVPVFPLADQFWGDRYGQLRDPFGHTWSIGSPIKG